ncbi:MAG: LytR C-terminal domain-containing protein [Nocardioidaceae bacterium]|nr:LytR C-terminal domain-containing protein [Nocardioidaceae bacterium]
MIPDVPTRLRGPVTLVSLTGAAVAVVVMAVWGLSSLTAPIEDDEPTASASTCAPEDQQVQTFVRRAQVTVSVYNTGKRKGRARDTLELLERAGFKPGEIGNGEKGDKVVRAEVRTTKTDDSAARLVALALGKGTRVVVTDEDYGPGPDVFIGDRFGKLDPKAPRRVALDEPVRTCAEK